MHVGQISMSSATGAPGLSGCFSSCVWYGRWGSERSRCNFLCEARSQPCATGVFGSSAPWNKTSLPSGAKMRSTMKKSASTVPDEAKSLSAEGPVISVSRSATIENVTPSPMGS